MSMTQLEGRQIKALGGDISGQGNAVSVDKIKGTPVSATAPTPGQALIFNGTSWAPATGTSGPASALQTTGADVGVSGSAPPTTGQVLTATSPTTATWQNPSGNPFAGTGSFVLTNTFRKGSPPDSNGNSTPETYNSLVYDGTNIWAASRNNSKLIKLNLDGSEAARYTSPTGSNDSTMMVQGGFLWMCGGNFDATPLYKVDISTGAVVATYTSGLVDFTAMVGDGTLIYLAGDSGDAYAHVYRFDPSTGLFSNLFEEATSFSADDIATDGGNIWMIDKTSPLIKRVSNGPQYANTGFNETRFTAITPGAAGNSITISLVYDVSAGSETISVTGNDITFHIQNAATVQGKFIDLVAGSVAASALIRVETYAPYTTRNYGGITNLPLSGGADFLLATIDVSASGTPQSIISVAGYLWAAMSNGDLIKIDTSDTIIATYPSGASALSGIGTDGSYFIYVVESAPGNKIRRFDFNWSYFVDPYLAGNTPNDIVWDNGSTPGNIWSIDRSSPMIRRLNMLNGTLLGTIDVSAYGNPRSGIFALSFLWVVTSNGFIVKIDPAADSVISAFKTGAVLNAMAPTNLAGGIDSVAATLTVQDVLYTAVAAGFSANRVTVQYTPGATAGSEVVTVGPEPIGTMTIGGPTGSGPTGIAFDGTNMWTANGNDSTVTKVEPSGASTTYSVSGANLQAIAFDGTNMWTANGGSGSVTKITPAGVMTTYFGVPAPYCIAFDGTNMWTGGAGGAVSKITPAGVVTTYIGVAANPIGIAFDGTNMWVAKDNSTVTKVTPAGVQTVYTGTGSGWSLIAFDGTNMWITIQNTASIVKVDPSGAMTYYSGLGVNPFGIAFDGTNMWVGNDGDGSVSKVSPSGSITTYPGTASSSQAMAFDGANFMWLASAGDSTVRRINVTGAGPSTAIAVQIEDGVSTAQDIVTAVSGFGAAAALVTPSTGSPATPQNVSSAPSPVPLTGGVDSVFAVLSAALASFTIIKYTAVAAGSAGNSITIEYTAGGTAGSEVVTVVGTAISVQIEDGVSKAEQVVAAVNAFPAAAALVTAFTNNRIATALTGITQTNGTYVWVSEPSTKSVYQVNLNSPSTVSQLDFSGINTPDEIAWDTGGQLWSMDLASAIIPRVDTGGNVQSFVNVSADGGTPRRLGHSLGRGLAVTMSTGHILFCDAYGSSNIQTTIDLNTANLSGIYYYGGNDIFASDTGVSAIARVFWDGGTTFRDLLQSNTVADAASAVAFNNPWLWTIQTGTGFLRKVSFKDGSTIESLNISAHGNPVDVNNGLYITMDTGKLLLINSGFQTKFATYSVNGVTYKANTPGDGGNSQTVTLQNSGGAGNTATLLAWDGNNMVYGIVPGVTTAQVLADAVTASGTLTAVATVPSQTQSTFPQAFLSGGGNDSPSISLVVDSGKASLSGLSDNSAAGYSVGFNSPSNGVLRFNGSNFRHDGSSYYSGGGRPDSLAILGSNLWISHQGAYPFNASRKIVISTMTPDLKSIPNLNYYAWAVVALNGFVYYGDNNYPLVHKVDPSTLAVINIGIGDQQGGNFYEWGLGLYTDGTSLWAPTVYSPGQFSSRAMDRLDNTGRVIAAIDFFDKDFNGNYVPMVVVGDSMFVGSNFNLKKFKISL